MTFRARLLCSTSLLALRAAFNAPRPSPECDPNTCGHDCLGLGYCVRLTKQRED